MEETSKKISKFHSQSNNKGPAREIISLPCMPYPNSCKPDIINQMQQISSLLQFNYSYSIGQIDVGQFEKENIYGKVLNFIIDIMNNHSHHFEILKRFEEIEKQIKTQCKKSIRLLPTRRNILKQMNNSLNQLVAKQTDEIAKKFKVEAKALKKVSFENDLQQSISIKLIKSKNWLAQPSKKNISFAKLLTFKDMIVFQEIQSDEEMENTKHIKSFANDEMENCQVLETEKKSFNKVSIAMFDDNDDKQSSLFSEDSRISLKDIDLPKLKLSQKLIEEIFDSPSPFLINLSLCLLFKFLMKSKFEPQPSQIGWLLGVSTLVAYKIFVDETMEGMIEYYEKVLSMKRDDLLLLERWFLAGLNYQVVISNKHYHEMLTRLTKLPSIVAI